MGKTTLEYSSWLIYFLNIVGILPVKPVYRNNFNGSKIFSGVAVENRAGVLTIHFLTKLYLILRGLFIIWRTSLADLKSNCGVAKILFPAIGVNGFIVLAFGLTYSLYMKKEQIVTLLNEWHLLELKVLKEKGMETNLILHYDIYFDQKLKESLASEPKIWLTNLLRISSKPNLGSKEDLAFQVYQILRTDLTVAVLASLVAISFNKFRHPRHIIYFYSLLDTNQEIWWLLIFSYVEASCFLAFLLLSNGAFNFATTVISSSLNNFLKTIIPVEVAENRNRCSVSLSAEFEYALEMYDKIQAFVKKFNAVLCRPLLFTKGMTLFIICSLIYVPIRLSGYIDFESLLVFIAAAIACLFRVSRFMLSMGTTHQRSVEFKECWIEVFRPTSLSDFGNTERALLRTYSNIQFRCGDLYGITSNTILTYLSVATSYIIVVLQFQ